MERMGMMDLLTERLGEMPPARSLRDAALRVVLLHCRDAAEELLNTDRPAAEALVELCRLARAGMEREDGVWLQRFDELWAWLAMQWRGGLPRQQVLHGLMAHSSAAALLSVTEAARRELGSLARDPLAGRDATVHDWATVLRYFERRWRMGFHDVLPPELGAPDPSEAEACQALYRLELAASEHRWLGVEDAAERIGVPPVLLKEAVRKTLLETRDEGKKRRVQRRINLGAAMRLLGAEFVWSSSRVVPTRAIAIDGATLLLRRGPAPGNVPDGEDVAHFVLMLAGRRAYWPEAVVKEGAWWAQAWAKEELATPCLASRAQVRHLGHRELTRPCTLHVGSLLRARGGA